jgi:predicted amidophosphoribosyltransferase
MRPHALVSLVVPPSCVACARATLPRHKLCASCAAALTATLPGASTIALSGDRLDVRWASEYSGVARNLIRALKFGRRTAAVTPIVAAMAPLLPRGVALVPVPAAVWRRRLRGLDPAEEIALALGREAGLEVVGCLRRGRGPRQVGRSRAERLADPPRVRRVERAPTRAVLVDDVFTTGATLAACANALGGACVGARVFARALGPESHAA